MKTPTVICTGNLLKFEYDKEFDFNILREIAPIDEKLSYEENIQILLKNNIKKYVFSTDWFTHNINNWNLILNSFGLYDQNRENKCLELGSWEGRSTIFIIENLLKNKNSELIVIDSFKGGPTQLNGNINHTLYARFCHNICMTGYMNKVKIVKGSTLVELPKFESEFTDYFDFIYIDASHTAKDVLIDSLNSFCLLKSGGIIIFDDYLASGKPDYLLPKKGIDTFIEFYKNNCRILHSGYQLIIQKI